MDDQTIDAFLHYDWLWDTGDYEPNPYDGTFGED